MRYASTAILACGMSLMCQVERVAAQSYERVQPIVLSGSPGCASPARIAPQPVTPYRGASYMSPSMSECIPPVLTASEFIPLPAGPAQPVNADAMSPIVEYRMYWPVVPPAERETVLRPPSADRTRRLRAGPRTPWAAQTVQAGPTGAELPEIHQPVTGWILATRRTARRRAEQQKKGEANHPADEGQNRRTEFSQPLQFFSKSKPLRPKKRPTF